MHGQSFPNMSGWWDKLIERNRRRSRLQPMVASSTFFGMVGKKGIIESSRIIELTFIEVATIAKEDIMSQSLCWLSQLIHTSAFIT
jgi:hypothetical protein